MTYSRPCSGKGAVMSGGNVSTAREALMAELLQDVDALVFRVERAHEGLGEKIEQATQDAAGKAFLAAKLNFESLIDQQSGRLTEAGRYAAALIGNQLNTGAAQLVATHAALERKARRSVLLLAGLAFVAGAVGGFIGSPGMSRFSRSHTGRARSAARIMLSVLRGRHKLRGGCHISSERPWWRLAY